MSEVTSTSATSKQTVSLESIISTAVQVPGVKVNRKDFLREQFKTESPAHIDSILANGPVAAGCPRNLLYKKATALVNKNTLASTGASFASGLPGGLAMAATIPADLLQFYAIALRTAQEISYLYGQEDLWSDGMLDSDKVMNQLILYCSVMLGSSGAAQTVRVLSSSLAQELLKQLPQKALTKTFYYPIVKSIAKAFGLKMTKNIFAKGVSKAVPVIGGVVSGGITFATMRPMGMRLVNTLDEANFNYTETTFESDWNVITAEQTDTPDVPVEAVEYTEEDVAPKETSAAPNSSTANSVFDQIKQAKQMLDDGIIDQGEFESIKEKLIAQL